MKEDSEYSRILWDDPFGRTIKEDNPNLYQLLDYYLRNPKPLEKEDIADVLGLETSTSRKKAWKWSERYDIFFWGVPDTRTGGVPDTRTGGVPDTRTGGKVLRYEPHSDVRKAAIRLQQEHDLALDEVLDICQRKVESGKFDSVGEALVAGARRNGLL